MRYTKSKLEELVKLGKVTPADKREILEAAGRALNDVFHVLDAIDGVSGDAAMGVAGHAEAVVIDERVSVLLGD